MAPGVDKLCGRLLSYYDNEDWAKALIVCDKLLREDGIPDDVKSDVAVARAALMPPFRRPE